MTEPTQPSVAVMFFLGFFMGQFLWNDTLEVWVVVLQAVLATCIFLLATLA